MANRAQCDIVLLVWNHLEVTRPCVESVLRWTEVPVRLLVVDNGSSSPTKEYLEGVRGNAQVEVVLLRNERNEGFPRGMNRGLQEATAPYVCLLNNDTVVAPRWLSELLLVAQAQPDIGIVNPSSNTMGQPLGAGDTVEVMADRLQPQRRQWAELDAATGFCMLIKQDVIRRIGHLDETFGVGYFEDTDFCYRAQQAGFRSVLAKAAYVYHEEHRSMDDGWPSAGDRKAHFDRNAALFHARWGRPQRLVYLAVHEEALSARQTRITRQLQQHARLWVVWRQGVAPSDLPEHHNLTQMRLPADWWWLRAAWMVLVKKKRFDQIYTDHAGLRRFLGWLRLWHRAEVMAL